MIKKINIDILRLIASFMIVAIHIYPFVSINEDVDYIITRVIFRIAVPFFLMITGYYILPKATQNIATLKKYTVKILKLYVISMLIYLPVNIYTGYFNNINFIVLLKDILINGTFYHLWYFPALILGLWINYYLIKKLKSKTIYVLFIFLYVIGLFGDNYYHFIENISIFRTLYNGIFSIFDYTRNGLFYTPIFIFIGYMFNNKKNTLTNKKNLVYLFIFLIFMTIEGTLLYLYSIPRHSSMYIFLIPFSYYLFNLVIYNNNGFNKTIRNLSTWIYILHPLFILVVRIISKILNLGILINNNLINYFMVLTLTIMFILFIYKVNELIKSRQ